MRYILLLLLLVQIGLTADDKTVLLAILARNKAHTLPTYLQCLDRLDYDKKAITVYINTNNNDDETETILEEWATQHRQDYANILFDSHEERGLQATNPHGWNPQRFKLLGRIRNTSLQTALDHNCDYYFVVDCDNFITPCTLKTLVSKELPIVAPMLRAIPEAQDPYSNYFCAIDENGYYRDHPNYMKILYHKIVGTFKVPVVHCTYLIHRDAIDQLSYVDNSSDYEFIIFSRLARKKGIDQFICNEEDFGLLLHFYTDVTLEEERSRFEELLPLFN